MTASRASLEPAGESVIGTCAGSGATFVTLLTGSRYAAPAACLPAQLRAVNSICRPLLVYNDADSSLPLPMLRDAFGASHMLPLGQLRARYNHTWHRREAGHKARAQAVAKADGLPPHGRRLFANGAEAANTHLKLWLWALPLAGRAVFLDIDIVILHNIDELLRIVPQPRAENGPAIGAVTCKSKYGERYFNSGVLVFTPSLRVLSRLLLQAHYASGLWRGHVPHAGEAWPHICAPMHDPWAAKRLFPNSSHPLADCRSRYGPGKQPHMMSKACESKLTDQSIFNAVFPTHTSLPGRFNVDPSRGMGKNESTHIAHFVGEPKPWSANPFSGRGSSLLRRQATEEWRSRCGWDVGGQDQHATRSQAGARVVSSSRLRL